MQTMCETRPQCSSKKLDYDHNLGDDFLLSLPDFLQLVPTHFDVSNHRRARTTQSCSFTAACLVGSAVPCPLLTNYLIRVFVDYKCLVKSI